MRKTDFNFTLFSQFPDGYIGTQHPCRSFFCFMVKASNHPQEVALAWSAAKWEIPKKQEFMLLETTF